MENKSLGFLGLGNMGLNMVRLLLDKGYEVHAWNRSIEPRQLAEKDGAKAYENIQDMLAALPERKIVWSMVAAGEPVDMMIDQLLEADDAARKLGEGDIFIEGVNSHYKDSIRRAEKLRAAGVEMLDCGVSGGIDGARNGACIMAGGSKPAFEAVEPIIKDLTQEDGYGYFGESGAGHFVKMVHNAIEYSMMQSIAEGLNLINESEYEVDLQDLTKVWNHGSIIESNLVGFLNSALGKDPEMKEVEAEIGSLGTGKWAVEDALDRGVPFTSIANAVFARYTSRKTDDYAHKIVQILRKEFGGHTEKERDVQ